jgi:hypothetical protein
VGTTRISALKALPRVARYAQLVVAFPVSIARVTWKKVFDQRFAITAMSDLRVFEIAE